MQPDQDNWHYSDEAPNGPRDWPRYYKAGESQSPINILVDYYEEHEQPVRLVAPLHRDLEQKLQLGSSVSMRQQQRRQLEGGRAAYSHYRRDHHLQEPQKHQYKRGHLDSVGNDTDSNFDCEDIEGEHTRSPSNASSNNSNDENSTNELNGLNDVDDDDDDESRASTPQKLHGRHLQDTLYCKTNKKIFLGYPRYLNSVTLSNTGHGWQVDPTPELASHTLVCGPPFGEREYRLAQFHCHWGASCDSGSEHQINGRSFSAELHFVHWDCSQYASIEEASKHRHGLAVLGVFVQALEGEQNRNKHLDKILAAIPRVRDKPSTSVSVPNCRLDLKKLFPSNRWSYATYEGSLTTPPLSECVHWLVFLQPITCSPQQLEQFRQLKCPTGSLIKNCRPVQPLNRRTVTIWSHMSAGGGGGTSGGSNART